MVNGSVQVRDFAYYVKKNINGLGGTQELLTAETKKIYGASNFSSTEELKKYVNHVTNRVQFSWGAAVNGTAIQNVMYTNRAVEAGTFFGMSKAAAAAGQGDIKIPNGLYNATLQVQVGSKTIFERLISDLLVGANGADAANIKNSFELELPFLLPEQNELRIYLIMAENTTISTIAATDLAGSAATLEVYAQATFSGIRTQNL
jgi:Ca2+-binding RTX toxin-like protein